MFKALFLLLLVAAILGGAAYFTNELILKPGQAPPELKAVETESEEPPADPAIGPMEEAKALLNAGDRAGARTAFVSLVERFPGSPLVFEAIDAIGRINIELFFSPSAGEGKSEYVVVGGDTLNRIASRNGTTAEMIMRVNRMDDTLLRIGDLLMLPDHDFKLTIHPAAMTIDVYNHGKFFKRYRAEALSLPGSTPGTPMETKVSEKIAWRDGQRVAFGTKEFVDSTKWILLGRPGWVVYSHESAEDGEGDIRPPTSGIRLRAEEVDELHAMLTNGSAVVIQ